MTSIKILISYHKPDILFKNNFVIPIHVGREIMLQKASDSSNDALNYMINSMIGDNTGNNISDKNLIFNEMTAIYWAWKNYDELASPDYIGFMHYRRHFIFKDLNNSYNECNNVDENYLHDVLKCDEKHILNYFSEYDYIVKKAYDISPREDYQKNHRIIDLEIVRTIISEICPPFLSDYDEYLSGRKCYYLNMFIFPKKIFFEYCSFIFPVLFEFEKRCDMTDRRMFISEWLTGTFITHLKNTGFVGKELPTMFVDEGSMIPIVSYVTLETYSCFNVMLTSLILNSNKNTKIRIYVYTDINNLEEKINYASKYPNIHISYHNIPGCNLSIHNQNEILIRISFSILENKFIFINPCCVILNDMSGFYRTTVDDFSIAGVKIQKNNQICFENGVFIINSKKIRTRYKCDDLINLMHKCDNSLTDIFDDDYRGLPLRSSLPDNFYMCNGESLCYLDNYYSAEEISRAEKYPLAIHYSNSTPWSSQSSPFSDIWCKYETKSAAFDFLEKDLVSIIIPSYNVESYIGDCINSLVNQSYKKIEIICVDDGSTDNTPDIIKKYVEAENNIHLIVMSNHGAGVARNEGLKYIHGEYLLFLDADDVFDNTFIEKMIHELKNTGSDITVCRSEGFDDLGNKYDMSWSLITNITDKYPMSPTDIKKHLFLFTKGWPWDKMYRTDHVLRSGITFQDLRNTNDALFVFSSLFKSRSIAYVDEILCYHRKYNSKSISNSRDNNWLCYSDAIISLKRSLQDSGQYAIYYQALLNWASNFMYWYINTLNNQVQTIAKAWAKYIIVEDLGMDLAPESYYTNKTEYNWIRSICDSHFPLSLKNKILEHYSKYGDKCSKFEFVYSFEKYSNDDPITIVLACNDLYAPCAGITIQSIIKNTSVDHKYDFKILYTENDLTESNISKLESICGINYCTECIDVSNYISSEGLFYSQAHYTKEAYYRFIICDIFDKISKIIYLDCDLIVLGDIYSLYSIDLQDNYFGAVPNYMVSKISEYVSTKLNLDPSKYINSGVMVINIEKCIKDDIKNKCYDYLSKNDKLMMPDQDALNKVCSGKIFYYDMEWNYQWHHLNGEHTLDYENEHFKSIAFSDLKIIHYSSDIKPWNNVKWKYSDIFWEYAHDSIFFADILNNSLKSKTDIKTLSAISSNRSDHDVTDLESSYFTVLRENHDLKMRLYNIENKSIVKLIKRILRRLKK